MDHAATKDTRNIFRLKKENEGIKDTFVSMKKKIITNQ